MDSIIKIENLIFEYKKDDESEANRAIDDVSLEIERGRKIHPGKEPQRTASADGRHHIRKWI